MKKIGLLVICTNKYIKFLQPLIDSADVHFAKDHDVTYFVFTNKDAQITTTRKIEFIHVEHKPWPWMTLERYKIFTNASEKLRSQDYLYYCDVDMKFVGEVGSEIISDRVGTIHPGFMGGRGTPESNPESLAYVSPFENMTYFAGGFNGGSSEEFLKMSNYISKNVESDYEKGIIAIWHDESHLNRYFIDNPPTKVLTPSYCYPESWQIPIEKKLLALDKDHSEIRSES